MQSIQDRNKRNAQSSTGPRTPEGKKRSSQNSLKFGMYSKTTLLPTEDVKEYNEFCADMEADLDPEGGAQIQWVQMICDHLWRLQRLRRLETNVYARIDAIEMTDFRYEHDPGAAAAAAWEKDCTTYHTIEKLCKHESRLNNALDKAMKQLRELKRDAREKRALEAAQVEENKSAPVEAGFVPLKPDSAAIPEAQNPDTTPVQTPDKVENPTEIAPIQSA